MCRSRFFAAGLAALLLIAAPAVTAQIEAFEFRADRVPVGKVLQYVKAQRDGSHATLISVYVAAIDRIETLKWSAGGAEATLVVAIMDWSRFSVRGFEAWHLARGIDPERRATLDVENDELRMSLMPGTLSLHHWPWHSYDFDFTSLNLALPHRKFVSRGLKFWRTDFVYEEPVRMAEFGEVRLEYVGKETRHGEAAYRYSIGGPGLGGEDGDLWVGADHGLMLELDLPVGDEPGYDNVRMKLQSMRPMTARHWQDFKRSAVRGS